MAMGVWVALGAMVHRRQSGVTERLT
jgi:hypothetical protein